jgi:hypothetical protein
MDTKDWITVLGYLGAIAVFGWGVYEYSIAEKWRRTHYLADLYQTFVDDEYAQRAMQMLDWQQRTIHYEVAGKWRTLNYNQKMLIRALAPSRELAFNSNEQMIRDSFDVFFDYFRDFEIGIQNKLISECEVYPYFEYWVRLLGSENKSISEPIRMQIIKYIEHFGSGDARKFLNRSWPYPAAD